MSTKSTNNNKLANAQEQEERDNHSDIQALYDELSLEQTGEFSADDEQPSAALDQSILAAAHKAVAQKPRLVITKRQWYVPLASAASAILVFSLFFNQLDQVPLQPAPLQSAPLQSKMDFSSAQIQMSDEPELEASDSRQLLLEINEQKVKKIKVKVEKKAAKSMLRMRSASQEEKSIDTNMQMSADKEIVELAVKTLSFIQYDEFKQADYLWTYIDENTRYYQIEIYGQQQEKKVFQLAKEGYLINEQFKSKKAYQMKKINLLK